MRLVDWRKQKKWTQQRLAAELGVTQPLVSTFERARNPAIPGPSLMIEIFELTGGAVQPNDFYDLPLAASAAAQSMLGQDFPDFPEVCASIVFTPQRSASPVKISLPRPSGES